MGIRINRFLKKNQMKMTYASFPFVLLGLLGHRIYSYLPYGFMIHKMCLAAFIQASLLCGLPIAFRAFQSLKYKVISIEFLVTLAVLGAMVIGEFEECALVTFLFQFGNDLELRTMKKTKSAIKELVETAPQTALLIEEKDPSVITEVDVNDIEEGMKLLVREGMMVSVDGCILTGEGWFDTSKITGESEPVHGRSGDFVHAGSILTAGLITMSADRVGEDTTYARIISLVEEAEDSKSQLERFIDRFARYYTPFVIVLSVLVLFGTRKLDTAITVLVLACPGALVIGCPIAYVSGIGKGAKEGILFKGGDVIHQFKKTSVFLFDKTGTLTEGNMSVLSVISFGEADKESNLGLLAGMEQMAEHPLGHAILGYVKDCGISIKPVEAVKVYRGSGMEAVCRGSMLLAGNDIFLEQIGHYHFSEQEREIIKAVKGRGETPVLFMKDKKLILLLGISDRIRENAKETIRNLKKQCAGEMIMLTGDHRQAALKVSEKLGLDAVYAGLLPEEKYAHIKKLQEEGKKVCFVGDGINDSPSITQADTGIAMGNGTDVAVDCSDIVLLHSDIDKLYKAYVLSSDIVRIVTGNILIAVGTVILLLVLLLMGKIHMGIGMLIHEGSILLVILNAMRLSTGGMRTRG